MLSPRRGDGESEKEAAVGDAGESQRVFTVQALNFIDAAGAGGSGREELERGDGDGGGGIGHALIVESLH